MNMTHNKIRNAVIMNKLKDKHENLQNYHGRILGGSHDLKKPMPVVAMIAPCLLIYAVF